MAGLTTRVSVYDLVTEALGIMGKYEPGEPVRAADLSSLAFTLNGILDGYGAERLTIFSEEMVAGYSAIANKQTYTLGNEPGDDFLFLDPPSGFSGIGQLIGTGEQQLEKRVRLVTDEAWRRIAIKPLSSSIISGCWVQRPAGTDSLTLNFWPIPSEEIPLRFYFGQRLARISSGHDLLILPAGYQELLGYELAIKASPKFGAELPAWVATAWQQSKTRIKEANYQANESRVDPALTHGRGVIPAESLSFYTGGE